MSRSVDFETLVASMQGKDCLDGWDMMIAYDIKTLNSFIARHREIKKVEKLSVKGIKYVGEPSCPALCSSIDPLARITFTIDYDLSLTSPALLFASNQAMNVTFDLGGTITATGNETVTNAEILKGTKLQLEVPIESVKGSVARGDGSKWNFGLDTPSDPTSISANGTVLNFTKCTKSLITEPPHPTDEGDMVADLRSLLESKLAAHFQTAVKTMWLTAIADPNEGQPLEPVAFVSTIMPGPITAESPATDIGTLCIWIAVKGGSARRDGRSTFIGLANNYLPLCSGRSAVMVLSNQLAMDKLIKPALAVMSDVKEISMLGEPGITVDFKFPDAALHKDSFEVPLTNIGNEGASIWFKSHVDGVNVNMNETMAHLKLGAGVGEAPKISWTSNQHDVHWSDYFTSNEGDVDTSSGEAGTLHLTFSLDSTGTWNHITDTAFNLVWDLPKTLTVSSSTTGSGNFWEALRDGNSPRTPEEYLNFKPNLPSQVDIKTTVIDAFIATQLIFPGASIFKLDAPTGQKDRGIAIPRDMIFTGEVKE